MKADDDFESWYNPPIEFTTAQKNYIELLKNQFNICEVFLLANPHLLYPLISVQL